MRVIYLDQNKWIELARAAKCPEDFPTQRKALEALVRGKQAGTLTVALTSSNIYETHKINRLDRRIELAWVQATLSQGTVFRGRHNRLEIEISDVLRAGFGLQPLARSAHWFLSTLFFEATAEWGDPRIPSASERTVDAINQDPPKFLFHYLVSIPEKIRSSSVASFSEGSERLLKDIEARRNRDSIETLPMRRRLHGARLVINEIELILQIAQNAGLPAFDKNELLRKFAKDIINKSPTYFIEREIGLKIEALSRPLEENDLRDMQAFCAVVSYSDIIVAENLFSNLSIQASLDKKYQTLILTDLDQLTLTLDETAAV